MAASYVRLGHPGEARDAVKNLLEM